MVGAGGSNDPERPLGGAASAGVGHLVETAARGVDGVRINAVLTSGTDPEAEGPRVARTAAWLAGADSDGVSGACLRLHDRRGVQRASGGIPHPPA